MRLIGLFCLALSLGILFLAPARGATPKDGEPIKGGVGFYGQVPEFLCLVKVCERPFTDVGSGTFVRHNLVLTCAHNVRDLSRNGKLKIHCSDGTVYDRCRIVLRDTKRDLCLIRVEGADKDRDTLEVSLADKAPLYVASMGWEPATSSMIFATGKRTGKVYGVPGGTEGIWIGHDAKVVQGMSGGPLINAWREIVGVNVSTSMDGKESHAVALKHIQAFLSKYRP